MTVLDTILTIAAGLFGGLNILQLIFLRQTKRKIEAEASASEFEIIRGTNIFLQEQLDSKEKRFAEQTEELRKSNKKNLELTNELGKLALKEQTYHCDVRNCPHREPPNGY